MRVIQWNPVWGDEVEDPGNEENPVEEVQVV